ncbi:serine hydrolase [Flexibacterium corallicola]|uniref:serine hydrolase n=1 Tax=Flexibacterium corallicola TaxID=3037259 RepID=UPI0038620F9E
MFKQVSQVIAAFLMLALASLFMIGAAEANPKYAGIVVDAKTGKVLYSQNAHAKRFPASTTKIMTLYVLFEELEARRMSLSTRMRVSKYASGRPPTKLYLKAGGTLRVKDAIYALVTKSANDASTVIAEHISGSEAAFARRMTATARSIGMKNTTFKNPHGLPNRSQVTTAYDLAMLGRAIQDRFPKYYKYFNTRSYTYGKKRLGNHNRLLGTVRGVDGIKTGYTRASGFNLVTNVKRDRRHIVAVVLGGRTGKSRDAQMVKLISRYMPKASRGRRTAPLLVARTTTPDRSAYTNALPVGKPGFTQIAMETPPLLAYAKPAEGSLPPSKPVDAIASLLENRNSLAPVVTATNLPRKDQKPVQDLKQTTPILPKTTAEVTATPAKREPKTTPVTEPILVKTVAIQPIRPAAQPLPPLEEAKEIVTASVEQVPAPVKAVSEPAEATPAPVKTASAPVEAVSAPAVKKEKATQAEVKPEQQGWQVQISASDSKEKALALLQEAKAATGNALEDYILYTQPVTSKNNQTLYRARFSGFETKTAAWNACSSLKQAKYSCYAVYQ